MSSSTYSIGVRKPQRAVEGNWEIGACERDFVLLRRYDGHEVYSVVSHCWGRF
jgi:hypothetical protein